MKSILLSVLLALCFGCWETQSNKTTQEKSHKENAEKPLPECEPAMNKMLETEAKYKKREEEYNKASANKDQAEEEYNKASANKDQARDKCNKAADEEQRFLRESYSIFAGLLNPKTSERIKACGESQKIYDMSREASAKSWTAQEEYDTASANKDQAEEEYNTASANKDQVCP